MRLDFILCQWISIKWVESSDNGLTDFTAFSSQIYNDEMLRKPEGSKMSNVLSQATIIPNLVWLTK